MDTLFQLIMGSSTTLDGPVIVRILIFCFLMEFIGLIFETIGRMR